jgi:N-acetylmuramoyl-L-alanine amidase
MKLIKYVLSVCLLSMYGMQLSAAVALNSLDKVYHHKGRLSDKVACYFSKDQLCNHIPDKANEMQEGKQMLRFFFPLAVIGSAECKQMVCQLNDARNENYSLRIESVTKPIKGLSLIVEYDPQKLGFEYETFTSIQKQPGVVFKFYHKDTLKEINEKTGALQQYAMNKKVHVVIDNGHGGEDEGKVGCFNIKEKDINLSVGMKVAQLLRNQGYVVSLTRNIDRFVALEERTGFANNVAQADLFVSIHSNGAPSASAQGIETFCSQQSLFNRGFAKNIDALTMNKIKTVEAKRYEKSHVLADHIHGQTLAIARTQNEKVPDRKVKNAISQVLLGTDMPCALIEIGFLSNEQEARLLNSQDYQKLIAQGICNGIVAYVKRHTVA